MKTLYRLLAIGMVLGLAFTALPMGQARAQTPPPLNVVPFTFEQDGSGTAAWSTADKHTGSSSVKLYAPASSSADVGTTAYAGTINDITSLSFWYKHSPYADWVGPRMILMLRKGEVDYYASTNCVVRSDTAWKQADAINGADDDFYVEETDKDKIWGYEKADGTGEVDSLTFAELQTALTGATVTGVGVHVDAASNEGPGGAYIDDIEINDTIYYGLIQDAIDSASAGDTINVAAGTYHENLASWKDMEITKSLSLIGAGSGVTVVELSDGGDGGKMNGVEIRGSGLEVLLQGITFTRTPGNTYATNYPIRVAETTSTFTKLSLIDVEVAYAKASNVFLGGNGTFSEVYIKDSYFHHGGSWGFLGSGTINKITVIDSDFEYNGQADPEHGNGFDLTGPASTNVLVEGGSFSFNTQAGINLMRVSDATFRGVVANNNAGSPGGGFGIKLDEWGGKSQNILFENCTATGNALDGITIQPEKADAIENVSIVGATLSNNGRNGLNLNYINSGSNNPEMSDVSISFSNITGNGNYGVQVWSWWIPMEITEVFDATNNWWGDASGPNHASNPSGSGDAISDNVKYSPWLGATQQTTPRTFYVNPTGTIQAAIDAASDGDTINVAAGTYAENVDVTKPVTLLGPNAGTPGNGTRVAEAIIQGTNASWVSLYVGPNVPGVMIDGFKFDGANLTPDGYAVGVEGDSSDLTVQNNVFVNHSDIAIMTSGVYYDNGWKYDKWLTDILIKDNLITNSTLSTSGYNFGIYLQSSLGSVTGNMVTNMRNGIQVQPYWNTPNGGTISGNTFEAYRTGIYFNYTQNATANWLFEDNNVSGIAYPVGLTADRFNAIRVETMSAGNAVFEANSILLGSTNATEKYQYFENNVTGGTRDASPNWWGSILGPAAGQIVGNVTYSPWCGDAECSFTVSATPVANGSYVENGQLVFAGNVSVSGGIEINEPNLTILLKNGTVIQNSSPCFVVNASHTKVTTESIGGAVCVPTYGSNGIDVAAGLTDIIIEGIEIDGSDPTGSGDGIHFAGAIEDVILRDNFIHDLGGDGVEFTIAPAGTVQVQGNLFMDNGGFGLNAPANLDVTYNAWGAYGGPTTGDDLPAVITSYTPWTHVDLSMASSGTDVANEVRVGETITYTIYANLQRATGADFKLLFDKTLLEVSSTTLGGVFTVPATGNDVVTFNNTTGEIHFAGVPTDGAEQTGENLVLFTVTFKGIAAGISSSLAFAEDDFAMSPPSGPSNNIYAAALVDGQATVRNHFTVTGTVSMQGRTVRSGVSFTLTSTSWGPFQTFSTADISDNIILSQVVDIGSDYRITIEQDRYLDLVAGSGKTLSVYKDRLLNPIELFGGDVVDDEVINVGDASVVGSDYYKTGNNPGDANFDEIVNIFDLALVGGNYGLESATAYSSWIVSD